MAGERLSCLKEMVAEKLALIQAAKAAGVRLKPATRRARPATVTTEEV